MKQYISQHKIVATSVAAIIILALVAAVFAFVKVGPSTLTGGNPTTATKNIEKVAKENIIGQAITNIVPDNTLGMFLSSPATDDWWKRMDQYNPSFYLKDLNIQALPAKPTMFGWSVSSTDTPNKNQLGLNTTYLAFKTDDEAQQVVEYLGTLTTDKYQFFNAKNVVLLIPMWAKSDINYTVDKFLQLTDETTSETNEGKWTVNFSEMQKIIVAPTPQTNIPLVGVDNDGNVIPADPNVEDSPVSRDDYIKVLGDALKGIGFNMDKAYEESYWSGTSQDGLNWSGNFSMGNTWSANAVDSTAFAAALQSTAIAILPDGTKTTVKEIQDKVAASGGNNEIIYLYEPNTSKALEYFSIQSGNTTFGTVRNNDGTYTTPTPIPDAGYVLYTFDPNAIVAYMSGQDVSLPLVKFDKVAVKLFDGSTRLDITLNVAPWADQYSL